MAQTLINTIYFILISFLLVSACFAENKTNWVREIENDKIRIFVVTSPALGHISAAYNTIWKLRQLGYSRKIETIVEPLMAEDFYRVFTRKDVEDFNLEIIISDSNKVADKSSQLDLYPGHDGAYTNHIGGAEMHGAIQPNFFKFDPFLVTNNFFSVPGITSFKPPMEKNLAIESYIPSWDEIRSDPSLSKPILNYISYAKHIGADQVLLYGLEKIIDQQISIPIYKLAQSLIFYSKLRLERASQKPLIVHMSNSLSARSTLKAIEMLRKFSDTNFQVHEPTNLDYKKLEQNGIHLVLSNYLPAKLFHYLVQESNYPIGVLGANSLSLALQTKKSFFPLDNHLLNNANQLGLVNIPQDFIDHWAKLIPQYEQGASFHLPKHFQLSDIPQELLSFYSYEPTTTNSKDFFTNKIRFHRVEMAMEHYSKVKKHISKSCNNSLIQRIKNPYPGKPRD